MAALYGVVETARGADLERATTALREVDEGIAVQRRLCGASQLAERIALVDGDALGVAQAQTCAQSAVWQHQGLQVVQEERKILQSAAEERYLASRLESEQMTHLRNSLAAEARVLTGRRIQREADDRFLSRRVWTTQVPATHEDLLI